MTQESRSFCRFCVALCGIRVTTAGAEVVAVKGDPEHPGSRGYTCAKGRSLGRWHHHLNRIRSPQVRRGSELVATTWSHALQDAAHRLNECTLASGPDSVGVYLATASSFDAAGRWAGERFARVSGSRSKYTATSIDTPCKPLVSLLMSGFPGLVPVLDEERCTLTVFVGCNPVVSHGHLNAFPDPVVRLRNLATNPRELWVVDTRRTESSRLATGSLTPRAGTDFAIFAYLVRELLHQGTFDQQYVAKHTQRTDLQLLSELLDEWNLAQTSAVTGCPAKDLSDLLTAVRRHRRISVQTGTGTTMSRTANLTEWMVWTLQIITGSYDSPGGMWFHPGFIRQLHTRIKPNHVAPKPQSGPKSRPEVKVWGDEYPCSVMADEIEAGNLRALIVLGGNPMSAFPNTERMRRVLQRLDALIVLDVVETETTALATHILPTKGQLERPDIPYFVDQFNLDCSTQYSPAIVTPTWDVRSMWWIMAKLAEYLGMSILPPSISIDSSDDDLLGAIAGRAAASFDEMKSRRYLKTTPVFGWVTDNVLPERRWRLVPTELTEQLADWRRLVPPSGLVATSRRQHTHLNSQHPAPSPRPSEGRTATLHPTTALHYGVRDGQELVITSAYGELRTKALLSDSINPDSISLPHGWRDANVSMLTTEHVVDQLTGMVAQTAIPVTIRPLSD